MIGERLAARFDAPFFERGVMIVPALSVAHYRGFMETSVGPMQKMVERMQGDPAALAAVRAEFDALVAPYFADNVVRQDYLFARSRGRRLARQESDAAVERHAYQRQAVQR